MLTISANGNGITDPPVGGYSYLKGTAVNLTATSTSSWKFANWSGPVANPDSATTTVTMDSNKNVIANFASIYRLLTSVIPSAGGSVSPSGGTYDQGATVALTATPASGYLFVSWSGDASGTNLTTSVTMDSDKNVIAYFEKLYQTIEYQMPPGAVNGSSVSYSKSLTAGQEFDGFVELTGHDYGYDWSYKFTFEVLGPGGEAIHQWTGNWVNSPHHDFVFTASYSGKYTLRVSHVSFWVKDLKIKIWPPGWGNP
jgi:hypothetical protein